MEHLLHLLSLSSSAGAVLNLSALALGLAALAFSLRALLRGLAGRSICRVACHRPAGPAGRPSCCK